MIKNYCYNFDLTNIIIKYLKYFSFVYLLIILMNIKYQYKYRYNKSLFMSLTNFPLY